VRKLRERLEGVERRIHELEARLQAIGESLADPELYRNSERVRAITTERKNAEEQVAWLMHEWEALSTELAARD
jgi:protein subunit release factor A